LREITLKILPFQRKVVILHADSVKVKRIPAGQAETSLSKALLAGGLGGRKNILKLNKSWQH
jgi:hypothetical protein